MFRPKKYLLFGAVAAAAITLGAPRAEAFWGWPCCTPCYTPCYSSCYTPCYSSCCDGWYVGVRPGIIRRALFGPYRYYYGGYAYYADCCSWDPCCYGEVGVYSPVVAPAASQPTPAPKPPVPEQPKPGPVPEPEPGLPPLPGPAPGGVQGTFDEPTRADSGLLTIYVPYGAQVTVNGLETKSTGSRRRYVSYGLVPGYRYKYEVRAQIVREGKLHQETKTIFLTAGSNEGLAFGFNTNPSEGLAAAP